MRIMSLRNEVLCAPTRIALILVVSRSLKSVGPNGTPVGDDLEAAIRRLKT
jgi:hypothetical protein